MSFCIQYVTWRNDETLGGISGCMTAIKEADPNFGMYKCVATYVQKESAG
jgi:hypothetical protein